MARFGGSGGTRTMDCSTALAALFGLQVRCISVSTRLATTPLSTRRVWDRETRRRVWWPRPWRFQVLLSGRVRGADLHRLSMCTLPRPRSHRRAPPPHSQPPISDGEISSPSLLRSLATEEPRRAEIPISAPLPPTHLPSARGGWSHLHHLQGILLRLHENHERLTSERSTAGSPRWDCMGGLQDADLFPRHGFQVLCGQGRGEGGGKRGLLSVSRGPRSNRNRHGSGNGRDACRWQTTWPS